jgi:DNA-binding Xre family transcriptional regulator
MDKVNFCEALNIVMEKYGLTNVWLGKQTGISDQALSNFRTGKSELKTGTLEKIINVLPKDAREDFFNFINPVTKDLRYILLRANNDEKAEILRIIAASISSSILNVA